jgi:hypothetical protein
LLGSDNIDIENILGIKLKWYQKVYLAALSSKYIIPRGTSKTGMNFIILLEKLKQITK